MKPAAIRTVNLQRTVAKGLSRSRDNGFKIAANKKGGEKCCGFAMKEKLHISHPSWAIPKHAKNCVNKVARYTDVWFLLSSLESKEVIRKEFSNQQEIENVEVVSSMLRTTHLYG